MFAPIRHYIATRTQVLGATTKSGSAAWMCGLIPAATSSRTKSGSKNNAQPKARSWNLGLCALLTCATLMIGCGEQVQLAMSSEVGQTENVAGIPNHAFQPLAFNGGSEGLATKPGFLRTTDDADRYFHANRGRNRLKPVVVKGKISAEHGGVVALDWALQGRHGAAGPKVKVEVKVHPGALEEDTEISIRLENPAYAMVSVDLRFGKHGTQFRIPAEVKLDLAGLDLSNYDDTEEIDCYWYNPDSDSWYPVPSLYRTVDTELGTVEGVWLFEHFSRYSLSGGGR